MPQFNDISWMAMSSKIFIFIFMVVLQISYTYFTSYKTYSSQPKLSFLLMV